MRKAGMFVVAGIAMAVLNGCAAFQKQNREAELQQEIVRLQKLLEQKDLVVEQKDREASSLEKAKQDLQESLSKELGEYQAKLEMTERGLVITFLAEIFFDSGKADIRALAKPTLEKVTEVLNKDVADSKVAIEGHTDTIPIKYSAWKSNWELSSARALAVLHYFAEEGTVAPERLSANGYGEYRPVTPNDTVEGRQQNRRVEIVILPAEVKKVKKE